MEPRKGALLSREVRGALCIAYSVIPEQDERSRSILRGVLRPAMADAEAWCRKYYGEEIDALREAKAEIAAAFQVAHGQVSRVKMIMSRCHYDALLRDGFDIEVYGGRLILQVPRNQHPITFSENAMPGDDDGWETVQ
jgi:hypothetical protein